ncbi:MAG: VWA domain-containing protein [Lysobacterales bacterium]
MISTYRKSVTKHFISTLRTATGILVTTAMLAGAPAQASVATVLDEEKASRHVDLVIALDVSGSMGGLINSARQRLWDIVNDLGSASPQPDLRVAVVSFGSPNYGAETGYVRIDQRFTRDLDAVNQTLFSFQTNGGEEYVARAIDTAVAQLDWSHGPDALRMLFVAGNESASQDPKISIDSAVRRALDHDIVVNTIYCGGPTDSDAPGWAAVAGLSQGMYASIDQQAAAMANVATPVDDELLALNEKLNKTYMAYGKEGKRGRENQLKQDANAADMSAPAAASRVAAKGSSLYRASNWDLLDAVADGVALESVPEEELPEPLQAMSEEDRSDYVEQKRSERDTLKKEIAQLSVERQRYISEAKPATPGASGLDDAISKGLRAAAEKKGFVFEKKPAGK